MCFSATASFSMSALLVATGIVSTITAINTNKRYLLLALIPIVFGIQQGIEGIIWWQLLSGENDSRLAFSTSFYLFFAYYFWPVYMPVCTYFIERNVLRKKILAGFIIAGAALGAILYVPLLAGVIPVQAFVVGACIHYAVYQSTPLLLTYTLCYQFIVLMSLFLSSEPRLKLLGGMILVASFISYWWYFYAFTSIWCFFSAGISLYIAYIVYQSARGSKST